MKVQLKKESKSQYTYNGKKYDYQMDLMDDGRSFTIQWNDKETGMMEGSEGWYGFRLKDCRELIAYDERN